MTCCVAALCDGGRSIVLAADKMIGIGIIESQPDIEKLLQIHRDWWVMLAGNDIAPAFPVIDHAKKNLRQRSTLSVDQVAAAVQKAYEQQRLSQAESLYLTPIGWRMSKFNVDSSKKVLPKALRIQLYSAISKYELPIQLLVAGFDGRRGRIFEIGRQTKGIMQRHDLPGFAAIGSGGTGARYMLHYRRASPKNPLRQMLYHAIEAKYFGELASGVGSRTDLIVIRLRDKVIRFPENTIEKKLIKLCQRLEPSDLTPKPVRELNELVELAKVPKIEAYREDGEWKIRESKET
jgi:20S proteasome alpha/beta subunit